MRPHHARILSALSLGLLVGWLGACTELSLDERLFACTTDADCRDGQLCRVIDGAQSVCVPADADVGTDIDAADVRDTTPDDSTSDDALDATTGDSVEPGDTAADAPDTDLDVVDTTDAADTSTTDVDLADTSPGDTDLAEVTDTADAVDTVDTMDAPDVVMPQTFQISGTIATDTTWQAPHTYVLTDPIYVESGATLTIEAGVTVLGEPATAVDDLPGGLVVLRGARLRSLGTAADPVVLTSGAPAGQRAAGDWAGVVMAGKAPVNTPNGEAYLFWYSDILPIESWEAYGGVQHASSCGELRHTRIEFAGMQTSGGDRTPGLLLGACGHQTVIDHVQVHRSHGNAVEIVGGSVPLRHLFLSLPEWSGLVLSGGYSGSVQFLTTWNELAGDTSVTAYNDYFSDSYQPATDPLLYNATFVARSWRAVHLRRSTHGVFANLVILGQATALVVEGARTIEQILAGDLEVRSSLFADHTDDLSSIDLEPCGIWLDWDSCVSLCDVGDGACRSTCEDAVAGDPAWASVFGSMSATEIADYFATISEPATDCAAALAFDLEAWLTDSTRGNVFDVTPDLVDSLSPTGLYPATSTSPLAVGGEAPPATDAHGVALDTTATWLGAYEPGQSPWSDGWTAFPED